MPTVNHALKILRMPFKAAHDAGYIDINPNTTARAAEAAATAPEPLQVSNTAHLRDLAASAARIFGWDTDKKPGVQLNQLIITREQLQEIRALQEQADAQEGPSDI